MDFQNYFTIWIRNICNNTVTKDLTTSQVCRYSTLWNVSVLKATVEKKTTSETTHFEQLTTGSCLQLLLLRHWRTWGVMGSVVTVLLQMFSWFGQWNKFENRSIFDEVKAYKKTKVFGHPVQDGDQKHGRVSELHTRPCFWSPSWDRLGRLNKCTIVRDRRVRSYNL